MMDDLIVKFCENRRSWLFVVGGTLVLALVLVLPQVDEYLAVADEKSAVLKKLELAEESARLLPGYEQRVIEQSEIVTERLGNTLNQQNEADYRNAIVKLVRESGCQLRRLNVGVANLREWGQGDDPLEKTKNKSLAKTGFQLERRQVSLLLAGPSKNVQKLLERFEGYEKLVHVESLNIRPTSEAGRSVELSMELYYYTLSRPAA